MELVWEEISGNLLKEIKEEIGEERLKNLKRKKPIIHFFYAIRQTFFLLFSTYFLLKSENFVFISIFSFISGFSIFSFLTLLHEVVHNLVFKKERFFLSKFLGYFYSLWCSISPTQFTRWHIDHHLQLGSKENDPKRHHLAPKKNSRIVKLLYFTPALFYIYFNASRKENKKYPKRVLRTIVFERLIFITIHLIFQIVLFLNGGYFLWLKVYFLPLFIFFPIAFGINRMGQHYARSSDDPLGLTTFIPKKSFVWDFLFLHSNYHLEHHLFPSIPFYNLRKLQDCLLSYYKKRGLKPYSFFEIFYKFIILNKRIYEVWN